MKRSEHPDGGRIIQTLKVFLKRHPNFSEKLVAAAALAGSQPTACQWWWGWKRLLSQLVHHITPLSKWVSKIFTKSWKTLVNSVVQWTGKFSNTTSNKKKCEQFTPSVLKYYNEIILSQLGYNLFCITQWEYSIPQNITRGLGIGSLL